MSRRLCMGLAFTVLLSVCVMLYDFRVTLLYSGQTIPVAMHDPNHATNSHLTSPKHSTIVTSPPHHGNNTATNSNSNHINSSNSSITSAPLLIDIPESNYPSSSDFRSPSHASPLHILLLSYQRSGSSIISSLFGSDPNVFFLFEPLDALYNAMYGTAPGWNVPADITINRDGSLRKMVDKERGAVSSFMNAIYNCDFQDVPSEFLVHPFWWYFRNWTMMATPYVTCLKAGGLNDRNLALVQHNVRTMCGQRLGDSRSRQGRCFGKLWPDYSYKNSEDNSLFKGMLRPNRERQFLHYSSSLAQLAKKSSFCAQKYLTDACRSTQFRAIKTVRATMESAGDVLAKNPALKVIHLLRDPRGVTRSRSVATWSRGYFEARDIAKTAQVYCTTALADIKAYRLLKQKYPDRVMQVVLEDFMRSPQKTIVEIYDFLGIKLEKTTLKSLNKKMKTGFVDKWKTGLDASSIKKINNACSGLLQEMNIQVES